jgi:TRAP-type C4-dicarboxylate transport system permease small subunit
MPLAQPPLAGWARRVDRVLAALLVVLMGAAVVNVLWQVFTRFVVGSPSSFTDELARYLMIWVGLLGAAYASGQRMHLAIDLLPGALEGRRRALLGVAIQLFVLLFALGAMTTGGAWLVALTLELGQTSPSLGLPLGLVYAALPASGLLIAFYALRALLAHVRTLRGGPPADDAQGFSDAVNRPPHAGPADPAAPLAGGSPPAPDARD